MKKYRFLRITKMPILRSGWVPQFVVVRYSDFFKHCVLFMHLAYVVFIFQSKKFKSLACLYLKILSIDCLKDIRCKR